MIVSSDVTAIANIALVELVLGDKTYSATNRAGHTTTFTMDATHRYFEADTPPGDGSLIISASANMTGHLMCSVASIELGDTGAVTAVTTKIGSGGVITLLAGDANNDGSIDNTDATAIGANMGLNTGDDKDVNGDNIINILDLVHVGRNFQAVSGSCGAGS